MKIVAIGGGGNGSFGKPYEVKPFDQEIIKLTGKQNPNYLFIGLTQASLKVAEDYYKRMRLNFGTILDCKCDYLCETEITDEQIVKSKINWADIIYVGGGNTLRLMTLLRRYKIDKLLKEAGEQGKVLCGVSAGAICWCNYGNSDSRKFTSNSTKLIKVKGLGFVNILYCPHYDGEVARQADLVRMMKNTSGVAIACENCTALKIVDNTYEVLKVKDDAKVYKCYYKKGEYIKKELNQKGSIQQLSSKD